MLLNSFISLSALLRATINKNVKPTAAKWFKLELSSFLVGLIWAKHSGKMLSTLWWSIIMTLMLFLLAYSKGLIDADPQSTVITVSIPFSINWSNAKIFGP